MNTSLSKALVGLGLVAVPASFLLINAFSGQANANGGELGQQVTERVLGADAFALGDVELESVEPFTLRSGPAAGQRVERVALVRGEGFYGTAFGPFVTLDGVDAPAVEQLDDTTLKVYLPADLAGAVELGVRLSDGRSATVPVQL